MNLKSSYIKSFFVFLIAGAISFYFSGTLFVRDPIRTITGTVTKVFDGDTIQATTPEQTKLRVRLYGIDAPEMPKTNPTPSYVRVHGASFGKDCKKALEAKIMAKEIRLDVLDNDKYKRTVGIIWLGNRNINIEMIQEGYAKAYDEYLKSPITQNSNRHRRKPDHQKEGFGSCPSRIQKISNDG
jgi:endonuclease YncB( thermonuclease family)